MAFPQPLSASSHPLCVHLPFGCTQELSSRSKIQLGIVPTSHHPWAQSTSCRKTIRALVTMAVQVCNSLPALLLSLRRKMTESFHTGLRAGRYEMHPLSELFSSRCIPSNLMSPDMTRSALNSGINPDRKVGEDSPLQFHVPHLCCHAGSDRWVRMHLTALLSFSYRAWEVLLIALVCLDTPKGLGVNFRGVCKLGWDKNVHLYFHWLGTEVFKLSLKDTGDHRRSVACGIFTRGQHKDFHVAALELQES